MTIHGHVRNGTIVLDEPCQLPEGAAVMVEIVAPAAPAEGAISSLYERLRPVIGKAVNLPPDAATNVDHYLYGHPKT